MTAEELVAKLEQTFFAQAGQPAAKRRTALAELVTEATRGLTDGDADALITQVKKQQAGGAPPPVESGVPHQQMEALTAENQQLKAAVDKLQHELKLRSTAYDHFVELSNHFLGDGAQFEQEEQIDRFCSRIKDSFQILLLAFKDLLKGRKRFQMEYAMYFGAGQSMEGTRVIRTGEDKDIGRKFFEWDTLENVEESAREMQRALDELKFHQLAFLSGYKNSVKTGTLNAIRGLAPAQLEQELSERKLSLGPLKIPYNVLPWKRGMLYREFQRRYEDLVREDVRYFEAKFRNAFTGGYVEVMNRKAKAQQKS